MRPFDWRQSVNGQTIRYRIVDGVRWARVPGFPHYKVSECGEVWSIPVPRAHGGYRQRVLPSRKLKGAREEGYATVTLWDGSGNTMNIRVHVLMAVLFIPNPNDLPLVRHLDDDRRNNVLANLAWGTPHDNAVDRSRNGGSARTLCEDDVKCILVAIDEATGSTTRVGRRARPGSMRRIAQAWGISKVWLNKLRRGEVWRHV